MEQVNCTHETPHAGCPNCYRAPPLPRSRGEREVLPSRRPTVTHEVKVRRVDGTMTVFVGVSRYLDGRPAELWIDTMREGHELRTAHHAWARMVSVALQHGVPFKSIKPPPAPPAERGIVEVDGHIETVTSVFEAALRLMGRPQQHSARVT